MANFHYIAKTAAGEEVSGLMQADNEGAVLRALDERQLYPVRVSEQGAGRQTQARIRVPLRMVGMTYAQLADLLRAGVPVLRALATLAKACPHKALATVISRVHDDIAAGKTLADAMGDHPGVFTPLHAAMVRAGEQAGFLEEVLANLSAFIERVDELRGKVRGAMIYPLMLTFFGLAAMMFILVALVPQFKPIFTGVTLPAPTMMLFAMSDLLLDHWLLLVAMLVLTVLGIRWLLGSNWGRHKWDRWRLKIPLAGRAMRMVSITRFCRILGTMLANGIPIIQALNISKDAAGCVVLEESIEKATENVRAGEPLAEPLRASGLFPPEIVEMIAVAEESNQLEKVLVQIADTVERRTNRQVDLAVRMVEPLILVLVAAAIGFMAFGLYYPIFAMARMMR